MSFRQIANPSFQHNIPETVVLKTQEEEEEEEELVYGCFRLFLDCI